MAAPQANGSGSVSGAPNGKSSYNCGTGITLTATPAGGWQFVRWGGSISVTSPNISFVLDASKSLTAFFEEIPPPPEPPGDEVPQCGGLGPYEDCSPIVINFEGGYDLTGTDAPVWFDVRGTGTPVLIGWTAAGSDEAFLWMDRNGNGAVDDGAELFGNATRLHDGQSAPNGFEALREFDGNGDSILDSSDAIWSALRLWRDINHDGRSEVEELSPVAASRVTAISLRYRRSGHRDRHGNEFKFESLVWLNGNSGQRVVRPVYDIFFVSAAP